MKLLSPKRLSDFTPEEFHEYVKGLNKPWGVGKTEKGQKDLKVRVKRKKDGTLSILTKRNPAYVTEKEFEKIAAESGIEKRELFLGLSDKGFLFLSHREAKVIKEGSKV